MTGALFWMVSGEDIVGEAAEALTLDRAGEIARRSPVAVLLIPAPR